jgi:hypothetical protein
MKSKMDMKNFANSTKGNYLQKYKDRIGVQNKMIFKSA